MYSVGRAQEPPGAGVLVCTRWAHSQERLDDAFRRLVNEELGYQAERSDARLLDLYEHLYSDSLFGETPDTHYVVVAHHLRVRRADLCLPQEQHSDFRWWSKAEMAVADNVHLNSRIYLDKIEGKRGKEGESRYKVKARH